MLRSRAAVLVLPVLLLAACSGGSGGADATPTPATSVPAAWLDATTQGWSDSDAHGGSVPVLSGEPCVLTDEVTAHGATGSTDLSGWGPYGEDADAFRYLCEFRGDDLSAQLQLIRTTSASDGARTVELFLDQGTSTDQENDPTTVEVAGVDVHVNVRWYPKTAYGEVTALFHDEEAGALVQLEVTSLDEDALAAYTPEQAATDLLVQLGRA
ncbi:hypothetical protein [Cellulomonas fimi]|uniref:Lipoprotein n=1 Tax=Cellulomonas fimi (strain ATCC 484 / DSM 20113 / JCM 1341 / CCUG 24087 / LMG 16345 / NBRC 15513 / NCIMB 8980 / NCTC 7547 / NRS-133) TaxID=590998 RepID=F4H716_CELFA|nr:hypothetical protein [Cellulomonas fimi]AEE44525.1 hypothetical protein Celf_0380 [Cellulomonas fimi ATCC 484]NNH06499.1 hypothetical protein [Cellulomonas fimi]VEH26537.1 Uncharacterised protein [Cellulomonas fimi]